MKFLGKFVHMGKHKAKHPSEKDDMESNVNIAPNQSYDSQPKDEMITDTSVTTDTEDADWPSLSSLPNTTAKSPAPKKGKVMPTHDTDLSMVLAAIQSLSTKFEVIVQKVTC